MKLSQPLPPIPPVQCRPSWVTAHVQFYQVTFMSPKYHSLDALWSLGRKSVFCTFLRVLYRVRNARSAFCTRVPVLYPVRNAWSSFYTWVRVLFCSLLSQPCSIKYVLSIPLLILEIQKNAFSAESLYHKDSNMFRRFNKVKPCSSDLVLGWVTKYEYPVLQ